MSPRLLIFRFCVILILLLGILGGSQRPVQSAADMVITVNSTEDLNDYAPGNSVCSALQVTGGPCTLRAAITEANLNIATPNQNIIIKITPGEYNLTIPPNYLIDPKNDKYSGDLNIDFVGVTNTNTITIEPLGGGPVVIRSMVEDRIFNIDQHIRVIINNLIMREGHAVIDSNNPDGGGAIRNRGNLTLNGVALLSNTVSCRSGDSCGGAGGAIENWSNLTIQDSTLDGNTALQAGAIWNSGNLTIVYSSISNNHTSNSGTITNNATLSILNSTFSGNSSLSTLSGIYNYGTLNIQSTTMANHGAINAIFNFKDKSTSLKDNIFKAEPGGKNCFIQSGSIWMEGGYNIANDDTCQLLALGDLSDVDPMLGSFDYWGGPTKTYMLLPGSPAIDHRPGVCQMAVNFLIDDQRRWPRSDGQCDTGAYEFSPWHLYLPVITK